MTKPTISQLKPIATNANNSINIIIIMSICITELFYPFIIIVFQLAKKQNRGAWPLFHNTHIFYKTTRFLLKLQNSEQSNNSVFSKMVKISQFTGKLKFTTRAFLKGVLFNCLFSVFYLQCFYYNFREKPYWFKKSYHL